MSGMETLRNPWGPGSVSWPICLGKRVKSLTLKGQLVSGQPELVPTVFS